MCSKTKGEHGETQNTMKRIKIKFTFLHQRLLSLWYLVKLHICPPEPFRGCGGTFHNVYQTAEDPYAFAYIYRLATFLLIDHVLFL